MRLSGHFVDPLSFGPYNFVNIPGTIITALTPERPARTLPDDALAGLSDKYDKVVLFLIDGLGWEHFERLREAEGFIKRLCERGSAMRFATPVPLHHCL